MANRISMPASPVMSGGPTRKAPLACSRGRPGRSVGACPDRTSRAAGHVHPTDPNVVFAGTSDGVYRSTDRGKSFQRTNFPDKGVQIWSFLVDAQNPKLIYAGGSPIAVYRSEDSGETWRRLPDPGMPDRAVMPFACRVMRMAQHPTQPGDDLSPRWRSTA